MKTLAWQQYLAEQRERHGKVLFSAAELANVAQTSLHNLNTELGRLVKRGLVTRYAQGLYGPPQGVDVQTAVVAIDPGAYVTGFYALFFHGLVTQLPIEITCFTNRRHNRRENRVTPAGRLRFICVPTAIYCKVADVASPEQALCDFSWLMLREGLHSQSLVTFQNLRRLKPKKLQRLLERYPEAVRQEVAMIIGKEKRI
jgi:predicted transcriptional regulator of viral defense system